MGVRVMCLCLLLGVASSGCSNAPLRPSENQDRTATSLDVWVEAELKPYLVEQLSSHPRFRGEPLLLVKMVGADVQPEMDPLTGSIRDRVMDALLSTPGVELAWRPAAEPRAHHRSLSEVSCRDRRAIHYYIGFQTALSPEGLLQVSVRALDVRQGSWVTGFGRSWRGIPTRGQRLAMGSRETDEYLRGLRVLPFDDSEADLTARYLAHNLSCLLRQQGLDDVVLYSETPSHGHPFFRKTLGLVGNYLARFREVRVTSDRSRANAILRGEAHAIYGDLHQVWITTQFKEDGVHLDGADTEAYVRLTTPLGHEPQARAPETRATPFQVTTPAILEPTATREPGAAILADLQLLAAVDPSRCEMRSRWAGERRFWGAGQGLRDADCAALELGVGRSAEVFLIKQDVRGELLRLLPTYCHGPDPTDNLVTAGDIFNVPFRLNRADPSQHANGRSSDETIYAIAVADRGVARRVARHLRRLADPCVAARGSIRGSRAMERWLSDLDALVVQNPDVVEWKALQVRYAP